MGRRIANSRMGLQNDHLVLRRTFEEGNLKPNWKGPYSTINDGSKCAYEL